MAVHVVDAMVLSDVNIQELHFKERYRINDYSLYIQIFKVMLVLIGSNVPDYIVRPPIL